ncbi:MAG TPA: SIMPL domain-containing protein [Acidimicrobiales bacterium]|nr:SIMPL domain-containing protein [Acidimicrobiales bacterium]
MSDHLDQPAQPHEHRDASTPRHGVTPIARMIFLVVFVVLIAAVAFLGETLGHSRSSSGATITVTGSGTVTGTPNTVGFQIGVQTTAASAAAALSENNAKTAALEASLLQNGVTKKNVQTSDLNIYDNTNPMGAIISFSASDDLNVTTHNLAKAGAAIDAAAHAVGNGIQLSGITFSISNESKFLASARARAIQNAHTEASQIAKGGGTTVGSIVKVTDEENTGSTGIILPYAQFASTAAHSVPIEAGSQSINVQVEVVYSLAS